MNEKLPNHDEILDFFKKERICLYCQKPFKYSDSLGALNCSRHIGYKYKEKGNSEEDFYICCGKSEFEKGCQICDHSEKDIVEDTIDISFYYIKNKYVKQPTSSSIVDIKDVTFQNENEKEERDLFKTEFKIKRIKKN